MNGRPPNVRPYSPAANNSLAPPLPPGPAPPVPPSSYSAGPSSAPYNPAAPSAYQPQTGVQDGSAQHAAAWAAYYQSQGIDPSAAYAAAAPSSSTTPAPAAGGNNAYANYGYGGAAQAQHTNYGQQAHRPPQQPGYQAPAGQFGVGYQPPAQGQYNAQGAYQAPSQQPQQPAYNSAPGQYNYNAQSQQPGGFQQPQQGFNQGRPPFQQQPPQSQAQTQPGNFGWNNQQQQPGNNNFRPQNAGPSFTPAPAQQWNGPQGQNFNGPAQPYRPPAPVNTPPRPFQPALNGRPPRPPAGNNFPPAKRPRFDGPSAPGGPGLPRPPFNGPSGSPGPVNGPIRPMQASPRPPHPGFTPSIAGPMRPPRPSAGPIGVGNNPPPIQRPPIHLGLGGPPPSLPGVIAPRAPLGPARGPSGPMRGRGGGVMGAPKGPSGRSARAGSALRPAESSRREKEREKEREKDRDRRKERERERDLKTTMTDFRIVGVRISGLRASGGQASEVEGGVWEWGLVDEKAREWNDAPEPEPEPVPEPEQPKEEEVKAKTEPSEVALATGASEVEKSSEVAVKQEPTESAPAPQDAEEKEKREESAEAEKRGEKRKATPEIDDESLPAKRPSYPAPAPTGAASLPPKPSFLTGTSSTPSITNANLPANPTTAAAVSSSTLPSTATPSSAPAPSLGINGTNGQISTQAKAEPAAPVPKHENSQNRFRIYFESPPELDRIPKAVRRGNKRWRRESTAPSGPSLLAGASIVSTASAIEDEAEGSGVGEVEELLEEVAAEAAEATADISAAGEVTEEGHGQPVEEEVAPAVESTDDTDAVAATENRDEADAGVSADGEAESAGIIDVQTAAEETHEQPGDVSMRSDAGDVTVAPEDATEPSAEPSSETTNNVVDASQNTEDSTAAPAEVMADSVDAPPAESTEATSAPSIIPVANTAEQAAQLAQSAEATASAYKTRARRRSSVSSVSTDAYPPASEGGEEKPPVPSTNRISVLFEESSRRICLDAAVVEHVEIHRGEGKIVIRLNRDDFVGGGEGGVEDDGPAEDDSVAKSELPRGVLVETYDPVDQRFVSLPRARLDELSSGSPEESSSVPPLQHALTSSSDEEAEPLEITVYLNKRKALSEPKWCRNNSADEWLFETFGSRKAMNPSGWRGKLTIVDPDPAPTLQSILDSWASTSSSGVPGDRRSFVSSLLADPNDLLEILLRLTRGERNPTLSSSPSPGFGALASAIRPDSPYASHQTHVSLAILAMYRLTTDYAARAGEGELVKEKIADIVRSLPVGMISKSLDGLFKEWAEKS